MGSDELVVVSSCAQTGGAIFAALVRMPPGGGPPVMHRHAPGEIYHVLEGEFTFYVGYITEGRRHRRARRRSGRPGDATRRR